MAIITVMVVVMKGWPCVIVVVVIVIMATVIIIVVIEGDGVGVMVG